MVTILAGTSSGCRVFIGNEEYPTEIQGRKVSSLVMADEGTCVAVIDGKEIWSRSVVGRWSRITTAPIRVQSLTTAGGVIFCGGADEAALVRTTEAGTSQRLNSFAAIPGRDEWFAGGPPLGVRSLTTTANRTVILAAVHVGGIPRSEDGGKTWMPTIPVKFDVHEVCAHHSNSDLVAAATAIGLCVSHDAGKNWDVLDEGLDIRNSLAVAALGDEFLFGISDGPFAKRSQLWRWTIGHARIERVRDGLPECLEGKIDTAQISGGGGCAAMIDGGGTLWRSTIGSTDWMPIAKGVLYPSSVLVIPGAV